MTFRYSRSHLYLVAWRICFVELMSLRSATGKPNFYPVNSCTDIKLKDIPIDVLQECTKTQTTIHCLPDENNNLGLSCFLVTWISEGKCPSYNSYQGNMDEKDCSTDYNATCPRNLFKSPLSVLYTGCYIKELIPVPTTTTSMTTKTIATMTQTTNKELSSDPMANDSIINGTKTQTNQVDVCECGIGWMIAFVIFCLLKAALIVTVGYFYKRKLCDRCRQKIRESFSQDLPAYCQVRQPHNDSLPQDSHEGSNMPMVKKSDPQWNGSLHSKVL